MTYPLLAYEDESFVAGPDGRSIRILAEHLAPLHALRAAGIVDTVVFFIGLPREQRPNATPHVGKREILHGR